MKGKVSKNVDFFVEKEKLKPKFIRTCFFFLF